MSQSLPCQTEYVDPEVYLTKNIDIQVIIRRNILTQEYIRPKSKLGNKSQKGKLEEINDG